MPTVGLTSIIKYFRLLVSFISQQMTIGYIKNNHTVLSRSADKYMPRPIINSLLCFLRARQFVNLLC